MKSFLKSKGLWGAAAGVGVSLWAILLDPSNYDKAQQCLTTFGHTKTLPILTLIASLVSAYGRMTATRMLYTPNGFPGNNPPLIGDPTNKLR
jgi:hypothetical protein